MKRRGFVGAVAGFFAFVAGMRAKPEGPAGSYRTGA